ncbi:hypothetical protein [Mangrovihabitans endophyticus]|nr:hypothetical protein [Mangrovihabitans endophyticus]
MTCGNASARVLHPAAAAHAQGSGRTDGLEIIYEVEVEVEVEVQGP